MAQYCRFCMYCTHIDKYWCSAKDRELSASEVKAENDCSDYDYTTQGDVDTGEQQVRLMKL